ncbi:ASCH domain-containing protein [Pontibacter sp. MBLB2868]|uniref:ASCH domain-containing protein n=1 Tax=Pontibacter sp. MBLB2868 TaxID=3451555 RepID=UPI003F74FA39
MMFDIKYSAKGVEEWKDSLYTALNRVLLYDDYWRQVFNNELYKCNIRVHLGVFVEPYLQYILDGQKTLESRFSVNQTSPYKKVGKGDIILIKKSGGPIVGVCRVTEAWSYELDKSLWEEIKGVHAKALCINNPEFWERKKNANYATLMKITNVKLLEQSINFIKADRRGWIVLDTK